MGSQKDHSKLLKNEKEEAKPPTSIHELQTLTGTYDVSKNKQAEVFCNEINNFLKNDELLFKRFNEISKKLIQDLMEVSKGLDDLSQCSAKIAYNF